MNYRLGLDLGTNSIGWAILGLVDKKPSKIIKTGVRIFPDGRNPQDKTSLAVARRLARQQRRMRDRFLKRQKRLMNALIEFGFMPSKEADRKALERIDPYQLRAKALNELVTPEELGRAIFHLAKRRGFKSNRKIDNGGNDSGVVKSSIVKTRKAITDAGCRTYGEWLGKRREAGEGVLARTIGEGSNKEYEVYADRALIEQELVYLWEAQTKLGSSTCTERAFQAIRNSIFFQRELLPVSPGKCTFEIGQPRGALADIRVQQFRIYQELNNLQVIDEDYNSRSLTLDERNKVANSLATSKQKKFEQINRLLGFSEKTRFNLESESRGFLKGNETSLVMAKEDHFGKIWHDFSEKKQIEIVHELITNESESSVIKYLIEVTGIAPQKAAKIANCRLPQGYGNLSLLAIAKLLPNLKHAVVTYDKAALLAGYNHSDFNLGEIYSQLPYYGQILQRYTGQPNENSSNKDEAAYGRIANTTVHIALNELRKVVNGLIKKYGHPKEIVVEIVRDLKTSSQAKKDIIKRQNENTKNNKRYAQELEDLGLRSNYENRQRFKLWEELGSSPLDRKCPFTGEQISLSRLFSAEVEIEHLIPFARSLDDGLGNKTLAMRKANRDKGDRTPFEAFGVSPKGYSWDDILDRVDKLPPNKKARFAPDAAAKFANSDEWLARQLNDNAYISRVARQYLTAVCYKDDVRVVPGKLTALFREALGLNRLIGETFDKERNDHRHHAIDALVVGLTERTLLNKASSHSKFAREQGFKRLLENMPAPWELFSEHAKASMANIVVSHKPDHGVEASLHNDTAYGIVEGPNEDGVSMVVSRKPVAKLKETDLVKVRDINLAKAIEVYAAKSQLPFASAVKEFSDINKVYRCKLIEPMSVILIKDKNGRVYKSYKGDGNYCYEIFELDDGKWDGTVISNFEANQHVYKSFLADTAISRKQSFCGKKLVMRLCRNDVLAIQNSNVTLLRVAKISAGMITLAAINEANVDARNRDKDDPFKLFAKSPNALKGLSARRIFIDTIGRVKDPGFRDEPQNC